MSTLSPSQFYETRELPNLTETPGPALQQQEHQAPTEEEGGCLATSMRSSLSSLSPLPSLLESSSDTPDPQVEQRGQQQSALTEEDVGCAVMSRRSSLSTLSPLPSLLESSSRTPGPDVEQQGQEQPALTEEDGGSPLTSRRSSLSTLSPLPSVVELSESPVIQAVDPISVVEETLSEPEEEGDDSMDVGQQTSAGVLLSEEDESDSSEEEEEGDSTMISENGFLAALVDDGEGEPMALDTDQAQVTLLPGSLDSNDVETIDVPLVTNQGEVTLLPFSVDSDPVEAMDVDVDASFEVVAALKPRRSLRNAAILKQPDLQLAETQEVTEVKRRPTRKITLHNVLQDDSKDQRPELSEVRKATVCFCL